MKNFSITH